MAGRCTACSAGTCTTCTEDTSRTCSEPEYLCGSTSHYVSVTKLGADECPLKGNNFYRPREHVGKGSTHVCLSSIKYLKNYYCVTHCWYV